MREERKRRGVSFENGERRVSFLHLDPREIHVLSRGVVSNFLFLVLFWSLGLRRLAFGAVPPCRAREIGTRRRMGNPPIHPSSGGRGGVAFPFLPTSGARGCRARGSRRKRGRGAGDITRALQVAVVGSEPPPSHASPRARGRQAGRAPGGPQAAPMVPCAFFAEVWAFGVRGELSLVNNGAKFGDLGRLLDGTIGNQPWNKNKDD
uniref:Uncharacterized protein n=1 Tax=Oryza meridionalis TaxID=40149 RepID=A0A0E0C6D3_9ORYZ